MGRLVFNDPSQMAGVRRFLYDATPDGCDACDALGLPPLSNDVAELEHNASLFRLSQLTPALLSRLSMYADVLATLWVGAEEERPDVEPEMLIRSFHILQSLAMASMCSVISTLLDDNTIKFVEDKFDV